MRKYGYPAIMAGVIGGAMLLFGPAEASATTLPGLAVAAPAHVGIAEEVQRRDRDRRSRRYDRHRHGSRHRTRRPGFNFYYGGYYYAHPWWLGPGISIGVVPGSSVMSPHVQWCLNRWRSYDIGTDTYAPQIGVRVRCRSPYPPPW
jgi:hypothetical protein